MQAYFNRVDLTGAASWHDAAGRRYIRTGDVGYIGDDRFLRITGRSKDMIISGGHNVCASDIEAVTVEHPAVAEAAVIAMPDERWGETPHTVVALPEGASADADELTHWLQARFTRTSWPSSLELVASLPRTEMGKILKRELREPFWKGRDRAVA